MTSSLILALVATFLLAFGGRDQLIVSRLSAGLGPSKALLALGMACAALSATLLAWAGWRIEMTLSDSAETMLVALALLLAGIELLWPNRERAMTEPTRSLGAIAIVLLARQVGDGPRFVIFAIAAATASPTFAAIGGAIGGAAALAIGWAMGADLDRRLPLRGMRIAMGLVVIVTACVIGLSARGLLF